MENENKELDFEPQDTVVKADEAEFDPTESEEFYNNLEAAIGGEEAPEEARAAEAFLSQNVVNVTEGTEDLQEDTSFDEALFAGVNAALAEQIEHEFGKDTEVSSTEEPEQEEKRSLWKAIPTWTKVLAGTILAILIAVGLLFGTSGGKRILTNIIVEIAFGLANKEGEEPIDVTPEPTEEPDVTVELTPTVEATPEPTEEPEVTVELTPTAEPTEELLATPTPTVTPTPAIVIMDDENIINVLLLGVENMKYAKYGRTDAIILVSIDLNGGPLKMISFQRDLYVSIPGRANDRLNAAFAYGGAKLIVQTIEQNFGIDIDSYVTVGFEGFENLIDSLGGLELSLTAREADYLTGEGKEYISKPEERNVVAGKQIMTGSQVLGYCRVRYVPTAEGLKDDRGRNYRHRVVLQAIFNQYKNKNITQLTSVMLDCFDYVTVPDGLKELAKECLYAVIENKMFEIETMQIPQSGLYRDVEIDDKKVIEAYPENVEKLQKFIYGED